MGNTDLRLKDTSQAQAEKLRAGLLGFEKATRLTRQAQALSDPTRVTILKLLQESGRLCVSDICLIMERGQSAISRHLKIALDAGLLNKQRFDLWVYYDLTDRGRELLAALLD